MSRPLTLATAWSRRCWLGLGLGALLLSGRAEVTTTIPMKDGALSTVRLTVLPNAIYAGGFAPVRVHIENRAAESRTWRIEFSNGNGIVAQGLMRSTFAFTAPATTTQETTVFVPVVVFPSAPGGGNLRGDIDGPDVATDSFMFPVGSTLRGTGRGGRIVSTPGIDVELRKLALAEREELARRAAARPSPRGRSFRGAPPMIPSAPFMGPSGVLDGAVLVDPAQWPADWRTWSQFHTVLMTGSAWEAVDPARRRALKEWVTFGGQLILFPEREGERRESAEGFGAIITMPRQVGQMDPMELSRLVVGGLARVDGAGWRAPALVEKDDPIRDLRIGGRWLVGFLVLFGVLIGPVNLFYFAPIGRRHRLFFTVPVISLIGSLVLAVVVVASDGWGGRGYRQTLVILLPGENEAAIVQRQVARTGMIVRQSFPLSPDTELDHRTEGGTSAGNIELERHGDRATGDWFSSRSIQYHELHRITPTRARVELVEGGRDGRAPVLQSSVGASLQSVLYRDESGHLWKTADLPPGRRITLQSTEGQTGVSPTLDLAPGCFYAEAGAGELAPLPTLGSIRWTDKLIHYTGRVEAATR